MIANLIIICFVIAMAYVWSIYGFFSAFLHLILVIASGTLALALWEPIAVGFLLGRLGQYAWGVALLGPFVLSLIFMRTVCDVLVRKNVLFPQTIYGLGGAACGLAGGILIAGLTWVGIGFLPLGPAIGGIQPYYIANNGQIIESEGQTLWFAVDRMAMSFFNGLSGGAFSTSQPLHLYQPDLAKQAATFRLNIDDNASLIARPTGVEVTNLYIHVAPIPGLPTAVAEALGAAAAQPTNRLVIVDTTWHQEKGTYDRDSAVRIAPSQVHLIAWETQSRHPKLKTFTPLAYSRITDLDTGVRSFHPFDSDDTNVRGNQQTDTFGFVFIIPAELEPQYALIRHLRVSLPEPDADIQAFNLAMGEPVAQPVSLFNDDDDDGPSKVGPRHGKQTGHIATNIALTNKLPRAFSRNFAHGLRYDGSSIRSGRVTVNQPPSNLSPNTRVDSVYVPSHHAPIRLMLTADHAQSLLGRALSSARAISGIWLIDERGQKHLPIGYVWFKGGNEQTLSIDPFAKITSAKQLPITKMSKGDKLYLYFSIPKPGPAIISYNTTNTRQSIDPPLKIR